MSPLRNVACLFNHEFTNCFTGEKLSLWSFCHFLISYFYFLIIYFIRHEFTNCFIGEKLSLWSFCHFLIPYFYFLIIYFIRHECTNFFVTPSGWQFYKRICLSENKLRRSDTRNNPGMGGFGSLQSLLQRTLRNERISSISSKRSFQKKLNPHQQTIKHQTPNNKQQTTNNSS